MAKSSRSRVFRMDAHPFFWFGQIFGLRNRALNRQLRPQDLDYQRMKVLAVLQERPGSSMQDLADLTAVDRTSLTHTVQLLIGQGLVHRTGRAGDRRSVALRLSAAGQKKFKRIAPMILRLNERTLIGFTAKEADGVLKQLRRMFDNLKDSSSG